MNRVRARFAPRATTSYNDPGIGGTCFVDAIEGCPIHLVQPHEQPPVEVTPDVLRNGNQVTVTSSGSGDAAEPFGRRLHERARRGLGARAARARDDQKGIADSRVSCSTN